MKCLNLGEVSLWLTQNASMEKHEETSELRDSEDDDDIKNGDKLEGNNSTNRPLALRGRVTSFL